MLAQNSKKCPCSSGNMYSECCQPYHQGKAKPPSAEKLMRSRYAAYACGEIMYIESTLAPEARKDFDPKAAKEWSKESEWTGLNILKFDDTTVEFEASYKHGGEDHVHHERSIFRYDPKDKCWYFVDGKVIAKPVVRDAPKAGRNDPCPCGSGKKHKKCCLAA
jgi:SEC-C motif-containing protein